MRSFIQFTARRSHPVWVCGLKLTLCQSVIPTVESHPVWVCGLKQTTCIFTSRKIKSHPVWVCGLKHVLLVRS